MEPSIDQIMSDPSFSNGLFNNINFLQSVLVNGGLSNFPPNIVPDNSRDVEKILNILSSHQSNNLPNPNDVLETYQKMLSIFKPAFEPMIPTNTRFLSSFPTPVPLQFQMSYMQPFPTHIPESKIRDSGNSAQLASSDSFTLSKPKKRLLKRYSETVKIENDLEEMKSISTQSSLIEEAPFGRSKCGKPLKRPTFVPSYMDNSNGPYLCVVCDHEASGLHYKAMTCEGCKGFFRRTIQQNLKYECKFNGDCDVSRRTKKDVCRNCRWNKCLLSGMAKNSVLNEEERRMKNELIKMNKLKRHHPDQFNYSNFENSFTQNKVVPFYASIKSEPTDNSSGDGTASDESHWSMFSVNSEISEWIKSLTMIYQNSETFDSMYLNNDHPTFLDPIIRKIIYFVQSLPGFDKLNDRQQMSLLQHRTVHCLVILIALDYNESTNIFPFPISKHHEPLEKILVIKAAQIREFADKLDRFCLSQSEKATLIGLILLFDYKLVLHQSDELDELETRYLAALNYTTADSIRRSKILLFLFPSLTKLALDLKMDTDYREIPCDFVSELKNLLDRSFQSPLEQDEMPLSLKIEETILDV